MELHGGRHGAEQGTAGAPTWRWRSSGRNSGARCGGGGAWIENQRMALGDSRWGTEEARGAGRSGAAVPLVGSGLKTRGGAQARKWRRSEAAVGGLDWDEIPRKTDKRSGGGLEDP